MRIAIPIYDRFTALDAVGPYEVLSRLPGATVHFVASALATKLRRAPTDAEIIAEVKRWKKVRFNEREITTTISDLAMLG